MTLQDFHLASDKISLVKSFELSGSNTQVIITPKSEGFQVTKNINWGVVKEVVALVKLDTQSHLDKANKFLHFLLSNSGLYSVEDANTVSGFQLFAIKIENPFGEFRDIRTTTYTLQFELVPESWIDVYAFFEVTFLNATVVGVQRTPH